jgi:hypothetical protein
LSFDPYLPVKTHKINSHLYDVSAGLDDVGWNGKT